MKKITPLLVLLLIANDLFAQQPCNDEIIVAVKGKWTKRPDANMKAGNQAQVTGRIDKMQQLLQAAYPEPAGIEAGWYRSMGGYNSSVHISADSYVLDASFKAHYCNFYSKKYYTPTQLNYKVAGGYMTVMVLPK